MTERGRQRVVVTGIGAVTPIGTGRRGLWTGVKRGRSAVGPVTERGRQRVVVTGIGAVTPIGTGRRGLFERGRP